MQNKMFYLKLMWGVFYGKGCKKTKITVHENSAWPLLELKKGGGFFIEVFLFFAIHKRHSKLKYFEC